MIMMLMIIQDTTLRLKAVFRIHRFHLKALYMVTISETCSAFLFPVITYDSVAFRNTIAKNGAGQGISHIGVFRRL